MNKSEAQQFLSNMYQDIVSEMNTEKLPIISARIMFKSRTAVTLTLCSLKITYGR
ncbi:hypothetical protein [Bacillus licheniformis]|uniref:hypothetical protein n=1 Tax=Bacillus licheniformis TaxID=1402 RepID=UPI0009671426|nr:hypothetical protein [Bacillus licheniformis]MEC2291116.1 hypothetical protein [Bacillus licheniformis]MEC5249628.1 hypothetical protein [Bacillus licheniformis]OLF97815.1 hypothetical protein B4094_1208 [Bacillus licheniformis]TWK67477.1 hypothetical protein CHCC20342_1635 [Bacillus licheniformis]